MDTHVVATNEYTPGIAGFVDAMLADPETRFPTAPKRVKADCWRDMFVRQLHGREGR